MKRSAYRSAIEPKWLLVLSFFVAGGFAGAIGFYLYSHITLPTSIKRHPAAGEYTYINPTLVSDPVYDADNYSTVSGDLKLKMRGLVTEAKNAHAVSDVAVYFRDLEPGTFLAINTNMQFSPGIVIKMPLLLSYYKLSGENPDLLTEEIPFDGTYVKNSLLFATTSPLQPQHEYTVNTLISYMVREGDETAASLLLNHLGATEAQKVFSDLGIDTLEDGVHPSFISLKQYTLFFRTLYNGTYVVPKYSEQALGLLAKSNTPSLLNVDLPKSVLVAAKVGGHSYVQKTTKMVEVYECGIVYYPEHNYVLCAAAQGARLSDIQNLFAQIGSVIYQDVVYRYQQ